MSKTTITSKRIKNNRPHHAPKKAKGYILISAVLAISVVATIALLLNNESAFETNQINAASQAERIDYIAEAGLAHTLWQVQNNVCQGDLTVSDTPFGSGHYSATVSSPATTTNSYIINADQDTYVDESSPDDNKGSDNVVKVETKENSQLRALFHFDLSAIPDTTHIVTATAWFYITTHDPQNVVNIYSVNAPWTENLASWNNIGDSYDKSTIGVLSPSPNDGIWVPVNLTALTQAWVNQPSTNYGLMFIAPSIEIVTEYSTREAGSSYTPRLEISTADAVVSPVDISTLATLSNGSNPDSTRTLTKQAVVDYQAPIELILQPDADKGKDTRINEGHDNRNYGITEELDVSENGGDFSHGLFQFNLGIPVGAKVLSAELALHQNSSNADGGAFTIHRVLQSWPEGVEDDKKTTTAANWKTYDGVTSWTTLGGDFDPSASASATIASGTQEWYTWDISKLVDGWVNGTYSNYGFALIPSASNTSAFFNSSDSPDAEFRPKLTVTYSCECGKPCYAPQGSGNILMIVNDKNTLTSNEALKVASFEAWGYGVELINDNKKQNAIEDAAVNNDVIYVEENVDHDKLGSRLVDIAFPIISEAGYINADLGIAAGSSWSASSSINISDNSHTITKIFQTGDVNIYTHSMEQLTLLGSPAPGLLQLGDKAGLGALVVLETGAALGGDVTGENAAGPRVMLPTDGSNELNWQYLSPEGLLLVQRAIQWGIDSGI